MLSPLSPLLCCIMLGFPSPITPVGILTSLGVRTPPPPPSTPTDTNATGHAYVPTSDYYTTTPLRPLIPPNYLTYAGLATLQPSQNVLQMTPCPQSVSVGGTLHFNDTLHHSYRVTAITSHLGNSQPSSCSVTVDHAITVTANSKKNPPNIKYAATAYTGTAGVAPALTYVSSNAANCVSAPGGATCDAVAGSIGVSVLENWAQMEVGVNGSVVATVTKKEMTFVGEEYMVKGEGVLNVTGEKVFVTGEKVFVGTNVNPGTIYEGPHVEVNGTSVGLHYNESSVTITSATSATDGTVGKTPKPTSDSHINVTSPTVHVSTSILVLDTNAVELSKVTHVAGPGLAVTTNVVNITARDVGIEASNNVTVRSERLVVESDVFVTDGRGVFAKSVTVAEGKVGGLSVDANRAVLDFSDATQESHVVVRGVTEAGFVVEDKEENVVGAVKWLYGGAGESGELATIVDSTAVVRTTRTGVGINVAGAVKAPLHVGAAAADSGGGAKFRNRLNDMPRSASVLVEGKSNTVMVSGDGSGDEGHVNGLVLGAVPKFGGSPSYWIVSQRGAGSQKKGGLGDGTLNLGWSDSVQDVEGDGLDSLNTVSSTSSFRNVVQFRQNGNVGVNCNSPSSRLTVGGDVEASDFLLFADMTSISQKADVGDDVALAFFDKIGVYKCEFVNAKEGTDVWMGLGGRKDWCIVAEEVESVDRSFVKVDAMGRKSVKLRPLVAATIGGVKDLGREMKLVRDRVLAEEKKMAEVERKMVESGEFISMLEDDFGMWKGYVRENNRTAGALLSGVAEEAAELRGLLEAERGRAKGEIEKRKVLGEQVESLGEVVRSLKEELAEVRKEMVALEEGGGSGGSGGREGENGDEVYFLGEVERKERVYMADLAAGTFVTDKQLDSLRGKWRVEAYEALRRRRADLDFLQRRDS